MKLHERNETAPIAALLIHPMLSSAEGLEQCVTKYWGSEVRCFLPDLSAHGEFELLKYDDLTFDHVFFEGVSFYERAPLLCLSLTRVFLSKHRKAVRDPELSKRKMSAIYGETAGPAMARRFISMNEASIRAIIHDCGYVALPDLPVETQKRCVFAYGEKDSDLRQCRKILPAKYPGAKLTVWPGYAHCGKMTADSENYAAMLRKLMED